MDLMYYIVFSVVYILLFNMAINGDNEMGFNFFLMIGTFILGGAIGYFFNSYDIGFVVAMIMSFLFM